MKESGRLIMCEYWNTRVRKLSPYVPGEQPKDRQFIKLNTNENPYPPSSKVTEAIQKTANEDLRLYPDPECSQLREAVAAGYGIKSGQVFAGNGSDEILAFAFGSFFEKNLLFADITYSFYRVYAGLWNIPYTLVPLRGDFSVNTGDYKIPCGGAVIANPNAPTGISLPLEDILSLAGFLEGFKKILVVDEAYMAFGAAKTQSAVPYINKYPNLLVVHTLSKSASLAGLRAGYAAGNEKLIEALRRMRDSFNSYTLDRLALAGAAAAVEDAEYYDKINSLVIASRERVTGALRALGFIVLPSDANFIFMKYNGIGGIELFSALRERGILVRHFDMERITDYIRVSIGKDDEMDKFLSVCGEIVREIDRGQ